jgi:hypothetical protein
MNIETNALYFAELQECLVHKITRTVIENIKTTGLSESELSAMARDIVFGVACALDSAEIDLVSGQKITPYLTFMVAKDSLIHCGGPSFLHEYVFQAIDEIQCT